MAELVRTKNWAETPLGPIESWPQSLRTTVSLCLASNFPINIIWGPAHTQIYNDGYRVVCGEGHPAFLGMDYAVSWASAWPVIGDPFACAVGGESSFLENQRMFLHRNGYLEEAFFTFSISPIRDETGGIGGLFHPVTETTETMLGARRTRAVRDLTAHLAEAKTTDEVFARAVEILAGVSLDLPFVLLYHLNARGDAGPHYRLVGHTGLATGTAASPPLLLPGAMDPWPVADCIAASSALRVDGIVHNFGDVQCGPYEEPPASAIMLPIALPGHELPVALVIAGASARLPLDDAYRGFYDLIAAALGAALGNASAYEEERGRAEALAAIDRAKTTFFSNISHEFRTPLTLMLGPIEDVLTLEAGLPDAQRGQLEVAHRNALRLLKLVNSLLDFSRIEASRTKASYELTDLAALTSELASNFRSACERAGLTLIVRCPPLDVLVHVDRDMWEKIVLNLMSNAFKFTLSGGITVTLQQLGADVELSVRDTGVGIPPDELPRVFERFHRVEGQRGRTHEGTGIGLALVDELVRLHGGAITASSVPGQGTEFRVILPLGAGHLSHDRVPRNPTEASTATRASAYVDEALGWLPDEAPASPAEAAGTTEAAGQNDALTPVGGKPRIILADDNADMRAYVARILGQGGYDVEAVNDGEAALAAIRRGPLPDLLLTDVMMPGLDGFAVLQALRSDPAMDGLLVILLSARAGEEARVEGLAAGADDYLVKPFSARELRARIDAAISLARQRREAAARERDLRSEIATERSRAALRESERRLAFALEAGRLGSWELDLEGRHFTGSQTCREIMGLGPEEPLATYGDFIRHIHPEDREMLENEIARAVAGHLTLDVEYRTSSLDGRVSWLQARGHAAYSQAGLALRVVGICLDVTARKQTERRQLLLLDELNHRVKNTLATVQSLAMQTRRSARSPAAFSEDLNARIVALSRAHDLLTQATWEGASLRDVLDQNLALYIHDGDGKPNVTIGGPSVQLKPNAAVTLNMAFHELATNAAKYGALSVPGGRVCVSWRIDHAVEPTLEIIWTESGGPAVLPPKRRGFGTRLIERGLSGELGGVVSLDYLPEGVRCRMHLPLSSKIVLPN